MLNSLIDIIKVRFNGLSEWSSLSIFTTRKPQPGIKKVVRNASSPDAFDYRVNGAYRKREVPSRSPR